MADNLKCSKCGGDLMIINQDITYLSYPPCHLYECKQCGHQEFISYRGTD